MSPEIVFVCGFIGAAAPEILRLHLIRNDPAQFHWTWFYLIISILFSGLGGFMAWLTAPGSYWAAFYVGISTPVLLNELIRKSQDAVKESKRKGLGLPKALGAKFSAFDSFIRGL